MNPLLQRFLTPSLLLGLLASSPVLAESYTDIEVSNNATIAGAAFFGSIQVDPMGNSLSHGMALNVSQNTEELTGSYIIPGYYQDNWVTMDQWGMMESGGHWGPEYSWQVVGQDYFPPVYDESGNVIESERWEDRYDFVYVGDVWVPGEQVWGIIGTYQDNQPVWVDEQVQSYSEIRYNAPVIHQRATRSDTNWVWEIPDGAGGTYEALRLWHGGLALADYSGVNMTLSPSALYYNRSGTVPGSTHSNTTAQLGATTAIYTTTSSTGSLWAEDKMEVRPELMRLTRTDKDNGTTTIGQTQIAAKSASFAGVVTVQGNLKVQGVLRVAQHGDIDMGEFVNGPQP